MLGEGTERLRAWQEEEGAQWPATFPWALTFLSDPQSQDVTFRILAARVVPSCGLG